MQNGKSREESKGQRELRGTGGRVDGRGLSDRPVLGTQEKEGGKQRQRAGYKECLISSQK